MNEWGRVSQALSQDSNGRGTGNIPFAPGIMTGKSSTPGSSGDLFRGLQATQQGQQARQAMQQSTSVPSGQPGSDAPPQMGQPGPLQWTPDVQAQVMDYLMNMLKNTGRNWRMTTTGGTVNETPGY